MDVLPCAPPPGLLTEGPVWDERGRVLLWVDILDGLIHRGTLTDGLRFVDTQRLDEPVGAVAPCVSGGTVAAVGTGFRLARPGAGFVEFATLDLPADGVRRRMNDAKCDPRGRLLAGTMAFDATAGAGALFSVDGSGVRPLLDGVTISNGLGWSPDGSLLYYADSATRRVDVFDYDLDTGDLAARKTFAEFDQGEPDGLTVDSEGRVWVAVWGAGEVRAYRPDGTLDGVVQVPAAHVSSCTFAGPALDILVITTATKDRTDEQLRAEPHAGRLFTCAPGPTGLPATPFDDTTLLRSL